MNSRTHWHSLSAESELSNSVEVLLSTAGFDFLMEPRFEVTEPIEELIRSPRMLALGLMQISQLSLLTVLPWKEVEHPLVEKRTNLTLSLWV